MTELKLEEIAGKLTEETVRDKVTLPNRKAYMSFEQKQTKASSYEGFEKEVARYIQHQAKSISGGKVEMDEQTALSKAQELLDSAYQQEGGFKGAYEKAKDDMGSVMHKLATTLEANEKAKHRNRILSKIDPTDFKTHVALANQYLKFATGLAPEVKARSAEDLAQDYKSVIMNYANMQSMARQSVQSYAPDKAA
ncbi:hypothetical protein ACFL0V_06160 [Nanoarchaeota archaeon]